jgi:hypothetical protein
MTSIWHDRHAMAVFASKRQSCHMTKVFLLGFCHVDLASHTYSIEMWVKMRIAYPTLECGNFFKFTIFDNMR